MHEWSPEQVAQAAGGRLVAPAPATGGPQRAVIDSRAAGPGDLFVGLVGENVDGGRFAAQALAGGAWGVLVAPGMPTCPTPVTRRPSLRKPGAVIAAEDPLAALQRLATAWRRALGCPVVGITGSVGKTSTKDILAAMLAQQRRTVANRENLNTEIGLPLTVLEAPAGTEALVLEMGMRGPGQIAELTAIAEPDVGLITAVAPVHLELMGSIEAIAAAKAELVAGLRPGGTAIVPAGETPAGRPSPRRRHHDHLRARGRRRRAARRAGGGGDGGGRAGIDQRPHAPQRAGRARRRARPGRRARRSVGRRALELPGPADRAARGHRRRQ